MFPGKLRLSLLALMLLALAGAPAAQAATRILVSVVEEKTFRPVADLKAEEFRVTDGGRPRAVEAAVYASDPVDVMMLVDTSLVGEAVQPVAADLIAQLREKEQMALVAYHSAADLIQDFTGSRNALLQALSRVSYGNSPRVLDALYAAADGGFGNAVLRRVILLITAGVEGPSRVSEREVLRLARRNGISIFPLYLPSVERSLFRNLAQQTGGVAINIQQLARELAGGEPSAPERVFEAVRGRYTLTLSGNLAVGERLKVELTRRNSARVMISVLPLD